MPQVIQKALKLLGFGEGPDPIALVVPHQSILWLSIPLVFSNRHLGDVIHDNKLLFEIS